jgi:hypothetical protein
MTTITITLSAPAVDVDEETMIPERGRPKRRAHTRREA